MQISLPDSPHLCLAEQLKLRLEAPRKTSALKVATANIFAKLDQFEDALAEYQSIDTSDINYALQFQIAKMYRAIGGQDNIAQAEALLETISASDSGKQPSILVELGDICRKRGDLDLARNIFLEALGTDPRSHLALRKLAITQFDSGKIPELLDYCEKLLARGIRHTRLNGTYLAALSARGRTDEANVVRGFESYFKQEQLDQPEGFDSIRAFNNALVDEILNHPALRFENSRQASENSWRVDELMTRKPPVISQLLAMIIKRVEAYAAKVKHDCNNANSLFTDFMPQQAQLKPWSIITREKGHENWHTHDKGWLSGVYYVQVPTGLPDGTSKAGAIEFGWPERLLGEGSSERLGNKIVHPEPGMLLLFPSHIHHRTFPHGQDQDRICISFDIVPKSSNEGSADLLR